MADERKAVQSIEELREQVPAILKKLNANPSLMLAAAANPILALEELGYSIPDPLQRELDRRIRFTQAERAQLEKLEKRIFDAAGESFDVDDPQALHEVLFSRLKLPPLTPATLRMTIAQSPAKTPEPLRPRHELSVVYRAPGTAKKPDVLAPLRERHSVVELLIEHRDIAATHAPFAPRDLYKRIRQGGEGVPAFKLRARVHRTRTT